METLEILYFSNSSCNVCKVLKPKIKDIAENFGFRFHYIDIDKDKTLAAQHLIFSIPTILITINGKEIKRFGRNIHLEEFSSILQRYREILK